MDKCSIKGLNNLKRYRLFYCVVANDEMVVNIARILDPIRFLT